MISWSALVLLLPLVSALVLEREVTELCGQYDTVTSGPYSLLTNFWGQSDATDGSQCSLIESVEGGSVMWYTRWTWTGGAGIKSFSNIQLNVGINQQLYAISSMPSVWNWSQENTGTVMANVAYDLFTSYSPGGSNVHEVMIWLANYNAKPISYEYDYFGEAVSLGTNLVVADCTWDLYLGTNGPNEVYSFLPVQGSITSFSGDIYNFFTYLIDAGYIASTEYLVTAQAGTEATSGTAFFSTQSYALSIV